jgi:hypothetical protein
MADREALSPAIQPLREALQQNRLACPACLGRLSLLPEALHCPACSRDYPVIDGIPVLTPGR